MGRPRSGRVANLGGPGEGRKGAWPWRAREGEVAEKLAGRPGRRSRDGALWGWAGWEPCRGARRGAGGGAGSPGQSSQGLGGLGAERRSPVRSRAPGPRVPVAGRGSESGAEL